jgi:hypothetical protein
VFQLWGDDDVPAATRVSARSADRSRRRGEGQDEADTALSEAATALLSPTAVGGLCTGASLRRSALDSDPLGGSPIPAGVLSALRRRQGAGQPLPDQVSAAAGEALGRDLSPVRVHSDPEAATIARSVQAVAFTQGSDIYFSAGSYRPTDPAGQRLLAHELGHVGQAESSGSAAIIGRADDPAEAAADRAATGVLAALRRQASHADPASHQEAAAQQGTAGQISGQLTLPATGRAAISRQPAGAIRRMKLKADGSYSMFGGDHDTENRKAFSDWVDQLLRTKNVAVLTRLRTDLHRDVFALADHEALALSLVQRALDQLAPRAVKPGQDEVPGLQHLNREDWWELFIEGDKHDDTKSDRDNALRFDTDQSPGYYAAMSSAFEKHVANSDGHPLTFADYNQMHVAVTRDTLTQKDEGGFKAVPHELSARSIQFPMTQNEFPNPRAIAELRDEGMLGLGEDKRQQYVDLAATFSPSQRQAVTEFSDQVADDHEAGRLTSTGGTAGKKLLLTLSELYSGQTAQDVFSSTLSVVHVTVADERQVLVTTNRDASAAQGEVNALFGKYYRTMGDIDHGADVALVKRQNKLRAIARLVRALHVGHYFHDANGRLNTMVLLNRLLTDAGFSPVLMNRTDIFGGAYSADELAAALETGITAFALRVQLAHVDFDGLLVSEDESV